MVQLADSSRPQQKPNHNERVESSIRRRQEAKGWALERDLGVVVCMYVFKIIIIKELTLEWGLLRVRYCYRHFTILTHLLCNNPKWSQVE
jgi:hypothetical protein